jgi:16S rRNA G966 N2-methylase RsmD
MIKNKFFAIGTIAIVTVMNLTMFTHSASAVECASNGVDTAVCVDENGNAAISTVDEEGNQITVDSDGNYEVEFAE